MAHGVKTNVSAWVGYLDLFVVVPINDFKIVLGMEFLGQVVKSKQGRDIKILKIKILKCRGTNLKCQKHEVLKNDFALTHTTKLKLFLFLIGF